MNIVDFIQLLGLSSLVLFVVFSIIVAMAIYKTYINSDVNIIDKFLMGRRKMKWAEFKHQSILISVFSTVIFFSISCVVLFGAYYSLINKPLIGNTFNILTDIASITFVGSLIYFGFAIGWIKLKYKNKPYKPRKVFSNIHFVFNVILLLSVYFGLILTGLYVGSIFSSYPITLSDVVLVYLVFIVFFNIAIRIYFYIVLRHFFNKEVTYPVYRVEEVAEAPTAIKELKSLYFYSDDRMVMQSADKEVNEHNDSVFYLYDIKESKLLKFTRMKVHKPNQS